jgi:uncharacterized protein (TIGR02271 family)
MIIANLSDLGAITGAPVHGRDNAKLGTVHAIYYDNDTNKPEWAAVKGGIFGSQVSLVPLTQANWDGRALTVPFDKDALKNAPHHDPEAAINEADEDELYRHYGMSTDRAVPDQGDPRQDRAGEPGVEGRDISGPTTDEAMTRSEERLRVGTEQRESGRARLRKHIVTEHVSTTVPVSHEEVTVEREPITDANRAEAMSGADLSEEEHVVTLTEQRVVVGKETVPVERVRLGTETVTEQQQVDETIRKEQIETGGIEPVLHRRDEN